MDIQLLGGAGEVGRSAILLKDKKNILLDCGVKLDGEIEYPMKAGKVDACVVSHAHLDHSGDVPSLYFGHRPTTYGTAPTAMLSQLLIEDSMKIARREHLKPRFFNKQLNDFLGSFVPCQFGQTQYFHEYHIALHNAGHIAGSAVTMVESTKTSRRVVYTGDFKLQPQYLQEGADVVPSDVLIMESTYAQKDHPNREETIKLFIDDIRQTLDNGGIALLPAFAVGRAQELLAILYKHGLIDYTFIDGMAKKASEIVMEYPEFTRNGDLLLRALKNTTWVHTRNDRKRALGGPSIIVTTSGMLNGGPVLDYITKLNDDSKIFLTGYQMEDTNGRRLIEGKPLIIDGKKVGVSHPFTFYDFSAHAGREDLHEYVKKSDPELVLCVHGDRENSEALAESLKLEGYDARAPKVGDRIKVEF